MDRKKKPAPGATLISRLRENRVKRDQELAEQKNQAAESKKPESSKNDLATKVLAESAKSTDREVTFTIDAVPTESTSSAIVAVQGKLPVARVSPAGDLINRSIAFDDLRPVSDDYDLLTEEIRLAGRFAAVGLIAQGLRLKRLREVDIYSNHYPTFEEYCRKEHNMSGTYAYRLIRMSEMAEHLAQEDTPHIGVDPDSMPDPFEVLLGLGHRHLLALLPLQIETAQELLVKGIPLEGGDPHGKIVKRIPISQATEQQIRAALRTLLPALAPSKTKKKTSTGPASRSVRTLKDMVDLLQDWTTWIESEPDEKYFTDRIGEGRDKSRLVQRMRTLTQRIIDALI